VAARWAHNPKVLGSNPSPATLKNHRLKTYGFFFNLTSYIASLWAKINITSDRSLLVNISPALIGKVVKVLAHIPDRNSILVVHLIKR
jgi:hypothetical protein